MRKNDWLILPVVTACLLCPAATCVWCWTRGSASGALSTEPSDLDVPLCLEDWQGTELPQDERVKRIWGDAACLVRDYVSGTGTIVNAVVGQISANGALHPIVHCLEGYGGDLEFKKELSISARSGCLRASLYKIRANGAAAYALLWYQWPGASAPNSTNAGLQRLLLRLSGSRYVWREVRLITPETNDSQHDIQELERLAKLIFEVPM